VSKQLLCVDTFWIHPWTVVTFHELVPQIFKWLRKPVREPFGGSERLMSGHRKCRKPYTLNH
jgi:hypothetical protein